LLTQDVDFESYLTGIPNCARSKLQYQIDEIKLHVIAQRPYSKSKLELNSKKVELE